MATSRTGQQTVFLLHYHVFYDVWPCVDYVCLLLEVVLLKDKNPVGDAMATATRKEDPIRCWCNLRSLKSYGIYWQLNEVKWLIFHIYKMKLRWWSRVLAYNCFRPWLKKDPKDRREARGTNKTRKNKKSRMLCTPPYSVSLKKKKARSMCRVPQWLILGKPIGVIRAETLKSNIRQYPYARSHHYYYEIDKFRRVGTTSYVEDPNY